MGLPLDDLLSLAERSYIRMEAEQLIDTCLESGDITAFDSLLKELVLAGSSSLVVMREILHAIRSVKSSLSQEGLGVRQDLMDALSEFGVYMPQLLSADTPEVYRRICNHKLHRDVMESSGDLEAADEVLLEELCTEAGNRVARIAKDLMIVTRLEKLAMDWMEGLVYESAHSPESTSWVGENKKLQ
jgi:hypothetical protein